MKTSTCGDCRKRKPVTEFYADKNRKNGLYWLCKPCARKRATKAYYKRGGASYSRVQAKKWREANPRASKSIKLKHAFGISIEEYEQLLGDQSGRCAICRTPPRPGGFLCVDHNHNSGDVRGLLCHSCNKGLGFFKEDTHFLSRAVRYLGRHA